MALPLPLPVSMSVSLTICVFIKMSTLSHWESLEKISKVFSSVKAADQLSTKNGWLEIVFMLILLNWHDLHPPPHPLKFEINWKKYISPWYLLWEPMWTRSSSMIVLSRIDNVAREHRARQQICFAQVFKVIWFQPVIHIWTILTIHIWTMLKCQSIF